MVNNSIQLFIAGFLENKKSLIFSDFIIVGSNSLQLITISYLPMQDASRNVNPGDISSLIFILKQQYL